MSKPFKLSCTLLGHSLDVRSVCVAQGENIISGSRDTTTKFWKPNGFNTGFTDVMTYRDQTKFVSSVMYLEASTKFPEGLVLTGGNDNIILGYKPGEPFASIKLKEHANTVCKLTKGLEPNTFLSGSWDTTAKYWNLDQSKTSLATFLGHSASVWGVIQISNGNVVTASADKTVGIYTKDGSRTHSIQAHSDCVRDVADFPELHFFITVSNDASIKVWSYAGENLHTYYGHTNFIYSIAANKAGGENCFVTGDEDRTVRYWKDGVNTEVINLPAQSVWSVACLNNGDIVTGSSDGHVRVFTQDENRYANEEVLRVYDESVEALIKQACQEIGGYKVSDLPGKEALYEPGKKAGQMKMIREPSGVVAYTWVESGENSHWEKVGEVLGGTEKNNEGKTNFEGKDYDFVFSVDVEDGKPPLKLPYNKGDDPYMAAHEFLSKNFLPASYLDQVVEFILKNSEQQSAPQTSSSYVDPYTGSARYVPGAGLNTGGVTGQNVDPFTGASSYATSHPNPTPQKPATSGSNTDPFTGSSSYTSLTTSNDSSKFYPQYTYRTFDMGDPKVILGKIKEFNDKTKEHKLTDLQLEQAINICGDSPGEPRGIEALFQLLNWPENLVFPVIDVLRIAVKNEINNRLICFKENGALMDRLKTFINQSCAIPNNTLVSLRLLCNLMQHPAGEELVYANRVDLLENIASLQSTNKNIQISLATFLLNISILGLKKKDDIGISILTSIIPEVLATFEDPEAQFRGFIAVGTLITQAKDKNAIKAKIRENSGFTKVLEKAAEQYGSDAELKRKKCAEQVQNELFS